MDPIPDKRVVGVKQTLRTLRDGLAREVLIASDADERVTAPVRALCAETGVAVREAPSMAELGRAVGIGTGASAVAALK